MDKLPFSKKDKVKVRFAPAPTGPLHIGGARTALFNYLFAKKVGGVFLLRIEDTDIKRSSPEWEKDIIENLKWLGIEWDEGPIRQSERKEIYRKYIEKLYEKGYLYWCFCSKEELEAKRQDQIARGEPPRYNGQCRNLTKKDIERFKKEGRKGVLRFKVPSKIIVFNDLIRGKIEFDTSLFGDFVVAKDFETPLYNLAVVIDDFEMKITHVIRGEDHLSNTPKQILIQEALGFPRPKYAHLPLILAPDRSKLSKRHGAIAVSEYRKMGYLPEALLNFIALLGWNPGTNEEIFSKKELIERFSLERVQKSGAVFNIKKLEWMNGYYIRKTSLEKLTQLCIPYLEEGRLIEKIEENKFKIKDTGREIDFEFLKKIISLFQERLKVLSEIKTLSDFFFKEKIEIDPKLLSWKGMGKEEIKESLEICLETLEKIEEKNWNKEKIREIMVKKAESKEKPDRGWLLWPFRVALTGKPASPPPFDIAEILGKKETLKRIKNAIWSLQL